MKKLLWIIPALMMACSGGKKLSNRELFEKEFDLNVQRCVEAIFSSSKDKEIDSLYAATLCSCFMNKAYEIDSTFVRLEGEASENFMKEHYLEISADCINLLKSSPKMQ
ncbi:MAG: hypothetical protein LBM06_07065 [Prevotellaceae bacterium]|jgi:hypothetical protein|nr:hypothetical protein [Prevotellaceae bacterium]